VLSVTSGWRGFQEVNRVKYDPAVVTLEDLVNWLKKTGTYVKTINGL
jgi:peptide methionine sulfoxide reductase MsrA